MSLAEQIARSFDPNAKKSKDTYVCKCPCHSDRKASLCITDGKDGKILMSCKANAGCTWEMLLKEARSRGFLLPKGGKVFDKYQGAKFYVFTDYVGNPIARTVKKPDKSMWIEHFDNGQWCKGLTKRDGERVEVGLYKPKEVLESEIVYLCEGEKDAETIIKGGLCGTTNQAGASHWAARLSAPLNNKTVIICQDNDEAGRKRTKTLVKALSQIAKELRLFEPPNVSEKGDVTDWVEAGNDVNDIFALSYVLSKDIKEPKKQAATRADYVEIIQDFFGGVKRDIFSEDLCYKDRFSNFWQPAANKLKALKSEVAELAISSDKKLSDSDIENHFYHLENSMQPTFVIEVPEWDGRDRIGELAERITIKDCQKEFGIDEVVFKSFLKYWHAKMWERLGNPAVRNEIFILAGEQNIGKDFWIRENLEALGQYLINFSIHSQEKDTKEQLHQGLVMNISEFDRTSKAEASLLKEIVTATQTNVRFAYDRRSAPRKCYCSFIASTNVKDIFNDPTGHSRYVFFEIQSIDKSTKFNDEDKLQVLAQGRALQESGFRPPVQYLEMMKNQINSLTPDDEHEIVVESWDYICSKFFSDLSIEIKQELARYNSRGKFSAFMPSKTFVDAFNILTKRHGKSEKWVRGALKQAGRSANYSSFGRGFYFKLLDSPIEVVEALNGRHEEFEGLKDPEMDEESPF